ncbi:MAG TPA: bifunctional phosphopantothenoylcysteine decarboxylase/phosphopantothenate--cysteine ligase CoaBC [Pseudobdellovibrionaceae bacterium]|nr:bifunctional phosphopantothenoylcysteine decarboxylase/phosphopantothenate--cysteine ligase CoaBC [Pseudobdellovibrionaceae bacterium]
MSHFKKIHFIITGSIAAYKAAEVLSRLQQAGFQIQTIVTKNALQFIGPATLEGLTGAPPLMDIYESGKMMKHIHEIRSSDLIIVAPATAHFINKISHGLADDFASTLLLAHRYDKPLLIAPAMNSAMYEHPETQNSLIKLKKWGATILEPSIGNLACGEVGTGRMIDPENIFNAINQALSISQNPEDRIQSKKILITSGGTEETIDSVRVLTNLSTGSTGVSLAEGLAKLGHDVTLLRGQRSKESQLISKVFNFSDFLSLQKLTESLLSSESFDYIIHAAAVSDFHFYGLLAQDQIIKTPPGKLSSENEELHLILKKNPKLVNSLKKISKNKNIKLISFKLTDTADLAVQINAVKKLFEQSSSDVVIQNDMSTIRKQSYEFKAYLKTSFESKAIEEPKFLPNKDFLLNYLQQYIKENL